ncbi:MAG: hypothetical protein ACTSRI_02535 [Promethearchaeota archaeon]
MGFKRVNIKDLETIYSPAFIGSPLKYVEDVDKSKSTKERKKISISEKDNNVLLLNEEILEFNFDKNKKLENFSGTGTISIINNSKKDRIWDARLKLSGTEQLNLQNDQVIKLGNFEPETNKKIKYVILESENLSNLVKLTENVEILNISTKKINEIELNRTNLISEYNEEDIKTNLEEKSSELETDNIILKEKDDFVPNIKSVKTKLKTEQGNLDKVDKKLNQLKTRMNELNTIITNLKRERETLIISISNSKNSILKENTEEKNVDNILDFKNSLNALQNEISVKEEELIIIEKEFNKKEAEILKNVDDEFGPQIKSINSELNVEQGNSNEVNKQINEWTEKKKKLSSFVKELKKESNSLIKAKSKAIKKKLKEGSEKKEIEDEFNPKIKKIESKLQIEQENLDKAIENLSEFNVKKKNLSNIIKKLKKEHRTSIKAKEKSLNIRLRELFEEKTDKIKEKKIQIKKIEEDISNIKDIENKFIPQLKRIESNLEIKQNILKDSNRNFIEWTEKRKELNDIIKDLKKEHETLNKAKSEENDIESTKDLDSSLEEKALELKERALKKRERLMGVDFKKSEINLEHNGTIDEFDSSHLNSNLIVLFNKNNSLKFTINLKNTSKFIMEDIKIKKIFSEDFRNFKYSCNAASKIDMIKGEITFLIKELKPEEIIVIIINADLKPSEKKVFVVGRIDVSFIFKDYLISGMNVENFTAFSHAMHAIKVKEKETEPNLWNCSLIFKNNSDLDMELKSILVLDKEKKNKYLDLEFNDENERKVLHRGDTFISEEWQVKEEFEPKFFRKLEYSVIEKVKNNSRINLKFKEDIFEIIDLSISKKLSKSEIKSFEEEDIDNLINIKNIGTIPVKGFLIKEEIPVDFIPPLKPSDFHVRTSSGKKDFENLRIAIIPCNQDPSVPHIIEIQINLDDMNSGQLIDVDEFLEIRYPYKAITPDYKKTYNFPLKVNSYYPKEKDEEKNYYKIDNVLSQDELPRLKIIHKRRDLLIGKEIFPGRDLDEFGISILVNNNSNIELKDIKINDTISKSFKFISSNIDYKILKTNGKEEKTISFTIEGILPYQEKEIRYYVKNISGEDIDFDQLESFIFG